MLKIGLIGAGAISVSHCEAINENENCTLAVVCDTDRTKAEKIAATCGAIVCEDYKDVNGVDAVIITLPHFLHCEVSCYFLQKGIHVLIEKPMANSVSECDKMIGCATMSGAKLAVGHVQKYYTALREVKKIIESKKYGKLCLITEIRNIDYLTNRPKWFLNRELSGGGIVMNYGAHSVDRIFYTTGLGIEKVSANISNPLSDDDVEICAQMLFTLEGGVSASVTYCGCHVPLEYETCYYFTNGVVKIKNGDSLCVYENGEFKDLGGERPLISAQLEEFVKYINGEESEVVLPKYGREVIKVLDKILHFS